MVGREPARLDQRERRAARQPLSAAGEAEEGPEGEEGPAAPARPQLCLCVQVHAADGAEAEPGRSPARGVSQLAVRRTASRQMIRRFLAALTSFALAACTAQVAPPAQV